MSRAKQELRGLAFVGVCKGLAFRRCTLPYNVVVGRSFKSIMAGEDCYSDPSRRHFRAIIGVSCLLCSKRRASETPLSLSRWVSPLDRATWVSGVWGRQDLGKILSLNSHAESGVLRRGVPGLCAEQRRCNFVVHLFPLVQVRVLIFRIRQGTEA